jgi:hypothetical protein
MSDYLLRGLGPPHRKQRDLLDYILAPSDHVKKVNLVCGRGFGKTEFCIIVAVMALSRGPREVGLFLEPDLARIRKVFLKKWIAAVPPALYTLNKQDRVITMAWGAQLFYAGRNVTGSHASAADSQLGQDTSFVISDEEAIYCNKDFYVNTFNTIRIDSPSSFYLTSTTPRIGPYKDLINEEGHKVFTGTSYDNPYLPPGYVDGMKKNMSRQQIRREIFAEFISLDGRIWPDFDIETPWPYGNLYTQQKGFDKNEPYWLYCDIGSATGAFVIVQRRDPVTTDGRMAFNGSVWVAVADFCPQSDGSANRAFRTIRSRFGNPVAVVAGADINTRSSGDGKTIAYFARKVFGDSITIKPVSESYADKQVQYDSLSYAICSPAQERRFCIADGFVEIDPDSKRGVKQVMEQDEWPDKDKKNLSHFLPKTKDVLIQHCRDALLMGSVAIMHPPTWMSDGD